MKFAINFLLFSLLYCAQSKAETILRFQTHITPRAKELGDLLLITPDKAHWAKIKLDSQPKNGEHIDKKQIIHWLQVKVGNFNYQWKGKTTVIIRQVTQSKARDLFNKAQTALTNQLKKQGYSHVELSSKTQVNDSDIPLADFRVQVPQEYPIAKRICVRLNITPDHHLDPIRTDGSNPCVSITKASRRRCAPSQPERDWREQEQLGLKYKKSSIPIWFSVKAYQSVLVMKHTMKYHTLIKENDVTLQKRNIAGLTNKPLIQLPKTGWLNKSINKNQILTQEYLSNQPQVIQGQAVKVIVHQQGISITTEALAQNNGYTGQLIRMKNPQTNKYFTAVVTGENQAEIAA